ncbi:MAG: FecR family protein [bacterium]
MKTRFSFLLIAFLFATVVNVHGMGSSESAGKAVPTFHPVITFEKGDVKVKGAESEDWEPASAGMLLLSGDTVETGKKSQVEIQFASGVVHMYEDSVMVIPSIGQTRRHKDIRRIFMDEGAGIFNIKPLGIEKGFEFRTKSVQGSVRGTVFAVKVKDNKTTVAVYSGIVVVSDSEGTPESTISLGKGKAIIADDTKGIILVLPFDPYDIWEGREGSDDLDLGAIEPSLTDTKGTKDHGAGIGADKDGSKGTEGRKKPDK